MGRLITILILVSFAPAAVAEVSFGLRGEDREEKALSEESALIETYLKAGRSAEEIQKRFPDLKARIEAKKKELQLVQLQIEAVKKGIGTPDNDVTLTQQHREFLKTTMDRIAGIELPKIEAELKKMTREMETNITTVEGTESSTAKETIAKIQTLMQNYGLDRKISDFTKDVTDMNLLSLMLEKRLDHRLFGEYLKGKLEYVMAGEDACQAVSECDAGKEPSEKQLNGKAWAR